MKVGILSSAAAASNGGESTEEEGLAEARNLATQAALLAIDAYLLAGVEGVPGWMATLLAVDVSGVDEGSGDEAGQEGLRMAQLLAVADWAVLEAYLCPEPPEEEGAGLARQPASLPAGQSFGLLRPLLDAPALVPAGVDHRLLQVERALLVNPFPSFAPCRLSVSCLLARHLALARCLRNLRACVTRQHPNLWA